MGHLKARHGSKIINGFEVPLSAVIFKSKKGVDYYISGSNYETCKTTIRYLDTGLFQEIDTLLLTDKFATQRKEVDEYWRGVKQPKKKTDIASSNAGLFRKEV